MKTLAKLSLLAAAALAIAAAAPSPAAAFTEFEAGEYPAAISGEQTESHTLTLEGEVKVKCKHVTFSGELAGPAETLTVTPSYSECTALGLSATVTANGCQYVFHGGEETEANKFKGTTDISCPTGQSIVIVAALKTCEAKIGTQSGLSSVNDVSELEATPANVKVEEKLSEVHYTVSKDEGTCPFAGTGEKTNGSVTANSLLKASYEPEGKEAEAVGLALVKAAATRLCSAAPVNGACPNGKSEMKGVTVKAASQTPAQPAIKFFLVEAGVAKNVVECEKSNIEFTTEQEVANPLPLEKFSATFSGNCMTSAPNKTKCGTVKMENAPVSATLNASEKVKPGNGILTVPMTLRLECAGEIENCEYKTTAQEYGFIGGNPNAIMFSISKPAIPNPKQNKNEKGCWNGVRLFSQYEVTQPKPVWVTN